jgi:hydrogenase maturation protease
VTLRIIGLGQRAGGDDAAGLRVIDLLEERALPGAELFRASDSTRLLDLIPGAARVLIVDAAVGAGPPGGVHVLPLAALQAGGVKPLSTHGMGVLEAVELARALSDGGLPPIELLAIAIEAPRELSSELSPEVARAVELAASRARELVESQGVADA